MHSMLMASLILLTLTPQVAAQSFNDGNKLLELCNNPNKGYIQGVVVGMHDASDLAYQVTKDPSLRTCEPREVTGIQMTDVVCAYLEDNPETRHYVGSQLFMFAMKTSWPCP